MIALVHEPIPDDVLALLWDVAPEAIDLARDHALVFERVMTRGTWSAMQWLRRRFPREQIAEFLRGPRAQRLSPRDLAYWALVADVELGPGPGGGRPAWAGP